MHEVSVELETASAVLRSGGVVLLPTDTVYGLAVATAVPDAATRLFALKGRRRDVPIAVLVADAEQAWSVAARPVPATALGLAGRWWPGALTLVVRRDPLWSVDLGGDPATVGLRCPDHDLVRALCRAVGPLATTSANRHGHPTPPTAAAAAADLGAGGVDLVLGVDLVGGRGGVGGRDGVGGGGGRGGVGGVDLVIDGGPLPGTASTVVDCTVDPVRVLREGAIPTVEVIG